MTKKLISYLMLIGFIGLFTGCEEDGTRVQMLENPILPTITQMPDMTFQRADGMDILTFTCTPVDPGFTASVNYYLEACPAGNDFTDSTIVLYSGIQDAVIEIVESDLNQLMLKKFDGDKTASVDFRIRAALVVDAGTGAPGTSANPIQFSSPTINEAVTPYGLPRLDLIGSGLEQKIESPLGDGNYSGLIKLDATMAFTLEDPDAGVTYGGTANVLSPDGDAFTVDANGWHKLTVDTEGLTYSLDPYMIAIIGDATPGGWDNDTDMEYNVKGGYWEITVDLTAKYVKFRMNDGWDSGINLGIGDADHPEYTLSNLWNSSGSKDIKIAEAGNYTIKLYIGTSTYSCTFTKN